MKSVFLCSAPANIDSVYAEAGQARLRSLTEYLGFLHAPEQFTGEIAREAEVAFSTWGMPSLTESEWARCFPRLKAVFYAAGSVQAFARPLLARGVRVFSAWQANAVCVAQYVFAQILLSAKGYFRVQPLTRISRAAGYQRMTAYPGNYDVCVGLIGCGAIGRRVATYLKETDLTTLVCDPYLSDADAQALGVRKVSMETLFRECLIVSNHLPNLPQTVGLIRRDHLFSLMPYATFINTGRGPQLDERDLYDALVADPTRTALLDVLCDEAHSDDNPLNRLENCLITPHIAGASGLEVRRMAAYMLDEYERMRDGAICPYEINLAMLDTMA